ncbi:MAG: hypothetical protein HQK89_03780 [Nitrospirae bacterium]|nr:hypothetical protein [Nitrospirota bacterium]
MSANRDLRTGNAAQGVNASVPWDLLKSICMNINGGGIDNCHRVDKICHQMIIDVIMETSGSQGVIANYSVIADEENSGADLLPVHRMKIHLA